MLDEQKSKKTVIVCDSVECIDANIRRLQRKAELFRILNKNRNTESKSLAKEFFEGVNIG